jgi:hypothetical protein
MSGLSLTAERAPIPRNAWAFHSVLAIGALPTATPCARLHARKVACEWGLHNLAGTIELVVSELVTNAVKASTDQDERPYYTDEHGLEQCLKPVDLPGRARAKEGVPSR